MVTRLPSMLQKYVLRKSPDCPASQGRCIIYLMSENKYYDFRTTHVKKTVLIGIIHKDAGVINTTVRIQCPANNDFAINKRRISVSSIAKSRPALSRMSFQHKCSTLSQDTTYPMIKGTIRFLPLKRSINEGIACLQDCQLDMKDILEYA